jgi:hypothetical protein
MPRRGGCGRCAYDRLLARRFVPEVKKIEDRQLLRLCHLDHGFPWIAARFASWIADVSGIRSASSLRGVEAIVRTS